MARGRCRQQQAAAAARVAVDSKPELPEGARIASANAHGASFWTQTARLEVVLSDGSEIAYFLKVGRRQNDPHDRRALTSESIRLLKMTLAKACSQEV